MQKQLDERQLKIVNDICAESNKRLADINDKLEFASPVMQVYENWCNSQGKQYLNLSNWNEFKQLRGKNKCLTT